MGEGVVQGACRGVVLLDGPVDAGRPEPVGECVDGLDEPACDVPPPHGFGGIDIFQVTGRVRGSHGGMEDQVREPSQLIFPFGDKSVHRRGRVAQRLPGTLDDLRRKHGPVEAEITVPQRFPTFPVVHSDRSDGHFAGDVAPTIIRSMKPSGIVSVLDFGLALIMP
jgi:hypothetical protein